MTVVSRKGESDVAKKDQAILDARMEYGHLMTTYVSLANMVWIGFGAFFTINSLLATALGVSYSDSAARAIDKVAIHALHILIPATGIFISWVAIHAAQSIKNAQHLAVLRGRKLEELLYARIFEGLEPFSSRPPTATTVGSLFFGAMWVAALVAGLKPIFWP